MSLKSRYDLFVFDLDGTLIDSRGDIARSANATLAFLNRPILPESRVASFVGSGVRQLMRDLLSTDSRPFDDAEIDRALTFFMDHYGEHCTDATPLYPGVKECLERLQDKTLAILTNKPELLSHKILKSLGIADRFVNTIGGDTLPHKKPEPHGLLALMKETGHSPMRTLMLGDSSIDVETARRARCDSLVVLGGFGAREELLSTHATWTFENFVDITQAL